MTQKDYIKLAEWLKSSAVAANLSDTQLEILTHRLCWQVLMPDNVRFDPYRFTHAVTGRGIPVREENES